MTMDLCLGDTPAIEGIVGNVEYASTVFHTPIVIGQLLGQSLQPRLGAWTLLSAQIRRTPLGISQRGKERLVCSMELMYR